MRTFKEWFIEDGMSKAWISLYIKQILERMARRAWIGALKSVLKSLEEIYDGDFENSEIVKDIEKELMEIE